MRVAPANETTRHGPPVAPISAACRRPFGAKARHDGFSLIEALIAVAVLGAGMAGVFTAMQSGAMTGESARRKVIALGVAESLLEESLVTSYASLALGVRTRASIRNYPGMSTRTEVVQSYPGIKGVAVNVACAEGEVRLFGYNANY